MGRGYSVMWRGRYLSAVGVSIGVWYVGWHVAVVLVIMGACPTALLVHVGVVCVGWRHRVEVIGGVVCSRCLTRTLGAVS